MDMTNYTTFLQKIDAIEVIAIELLTKAVAWIAPSVTAILIVSSLVSEPLNFSWSVAILFGFMIEALGLSFVSTMVFFFSEWRGRLPEFGAFSVSLFCVIGYAVVAFPTVAIIKLFPEYSSLVPAGGVLLSMLSGLIVGVRSNWQKYQIRAVSEAKEAKSELAKMQKRIESAKERYDYFDKLTIFAGKDIEQGSSEWHILRDLIWKRDKKVCIYCNSNLTSSTYHCHHIIPAAVGGKGNPANLTTLCADCHEKVHSDDNPFVGGLSNLMNAGEKGRLYQKSKMQERKERALQLRNEGFTEKQICESLGVKDVRTVRGYLEAINVNGGSK